MPVGVQCPISSSLGEFPSYRDWLWCPGLSPVLVSIALLFPFHTWCFPFALICHWISIVFLLFFLPLSTHFLSPSFRFPYLVFSIRSYLPLDFNRISSLRPTYRNPFGRPFTYSLFGEFPGLGLTLVPDVVVPEAEQRCAWSRKLDPNFCPGRGRTSELGI